MALGGKIIPHLSFLTINFEKEFASVMLNLSVTVHSFHAGILMRKQLVLCDI